MAPSMTPRDAFKRASLYQTCRRSQILSNVRFDELSTEALVELVNQYNAQTITHVPILASKFLVKSLLGLVTQRFPGTLAYISPDNIRVVVEDDELAHLASAQPTKDSSTNIVLIVGKNILMALVGNSIVQLRDILADKGVAASPPGTATETMDEQVETVPGFERIRLASSRSDDGFDGNRRVLAELKVRPNFNDSFGAAKIGTAAAAASSSVRDASSVSGSVGTPELAASAAPDDDAAVACESDAEAASSYVDDSMSVAGSVGRKRTRSIDAESHCTNSSNGKRARVEQRSVASSRASNYAEDEAHVESDAEFELIESQVESSEEDDIRPSPSQLKSQELRPFFDEIAGMLAPNGADASSLGEAESLTPAAVGTAPATNTAAVVVSVVPPAAPPTKPHRLVEKFDFAGLSF